MPHFALMIDPAPEARQDFLVKALGLFHDPFSMAARHAETQSAILVYAEESPARCTADATHLEFDLLPDEAYGVRLTINDGDVTLTPDFLGLFPVFVWHQGTTFICASSPTFFLAHSAFRPRLDEHGLALALLLMHTACGRTLWRGVRRLPAATELTWSNGIAKEHRLSWVPVELAEIDWPTLQREIDDCLLASLERCGPEPLLLLSGGVDSRILAGYVQELGRPGRALTFGIPSDHEARIARRVARTTGLRHELINVDLSRFPEWAWRQIHSCHVTTSVTDFSLWQLAGMQLSQPLISGYLGDSVMGGSHINWAWDKTRGEFNFPSLLREIRKYGLPMDVLRRLLRFPNADVVLAEALELLKQEFDSYDGLPFQKAWRFDLHHRQRFHIAKNFFRIAIKSWPATPYASRKLLDLCARLPLERIRGRAAQFDLLRRRFPELARLPLDRNSHDVRPVVQNDLGRLWWTIRSRVANRMRTWRNTTENEQRYYHRIYNFNANPGWLAIRREALSVAPGLSHLFDLQTVRDLLPTSPIDLKGPSDIAGTSGHKTLCCLLLWASKYARSAA